MIKAIHWELVFSLIDLTIIGSFGRVKIAKNKKTGDYVALKIMKKVEIIRAKQTDHIMNEINILAMIEHPFIVISSFTQLDKL